VNASTNVSTARALQQAAIKLLRSNEYSHPFYWAGFVVVGNGR
jgi:CHAT domain-containing protein